MRSMCCCCCCCCWVVRGRQGGDSGCRALLGKHGRTWCCPSAKRSVRQLGGGSINRQPWRCAVLPGCDPSSLPRPRSAEAVMSWKGTPAAPADNPLPRDGSSIRQARRGEATRGRIRAGEAGRTDGQTGSQRHEAARTFALSHSLAGISLMPDDDNSCCLFVCLLACLFVRSLTLMLLLHHQSSMITRLSALAPSSLIPREKFINKNAVRFHQVGVDR